MDTKAPQDPATATELTQFVQGLLMQMRGRFDTMTGEEAMHPRHVRPRHACLHSCSMRRLCPECMDMVSSTDPHPRISGPSALLLLKHLQAQPLVTSDLTTRCIPLLHSIHHWEDR